MGREVRAGGGGFLREVRRRRVERVRVRPELSHDEVGLRWSLQANRDVGFAPRQAHRAAARDERPLDLGVLAAELGRARREEAAAEGLDRRHAHGALHGAIAPADATLERERSLLHLARETEYLVPLRRQGEPVPPATKELRPERRLQRRDAPPDRRLIEADRLRGGREAARRRDRQEDPQIGPLEHEDERSAEGCTNARKTGNCALARDRRGGSS
jgi:hypothetical protein